MTTPAPPPSLPPEPDRAAQVERLREVAQQLVQQLDDLGEDSGEQFLALARKARANRRMIRVLAFLVALGVATSGILVVVVLGVISNNHRIGQLTQRLNTSQTTTRKNSLCPLYTLLKDSDTPAARAAAPDKAAYDHAVMVIRGGYEALKCGDFVSSPPTIGPTAGG